MQKYNIAELARGRTRRRRVEMRPIRPAVALSLEYRKLLRRYVRELETSATESVLPIVEAHEQLTQDREPWFDRLRELERQARARLMLGVRSIFLRQGKRHQEKFMRQTRQLLGIDLQAVIREEDFGELLEIYSAQNASLITSLGADTIKKVEAVVYRHQLGEVGYENLSKMLQKEFHLSRVRADLISADQVQKLGADLNKLRQEQAGITSYVWRSARDKRVRDRHEKLDGKTFKWGEPTGAEEGLPPGKPIRCRCVAIAQIEIPQ